MQTLIKGGSPPGGGSAGGVNESCHCRQRSRELKRLGRPRRTLPGFEDLCETRGKRVRLERHSGACAVLRVDQLRDSSPIAREKRDSFLETLLDRARRVVRLRRYHGEPPGPKQILQGTRAAAGREQRPFEAPRFPPHADIIRA